MKDPWALVQTTRTQIESSKQTVIQLQQYRNMVENLILQSKNLESINPSIIKNAINRGWLPPEAIALDSGMDIARSAAGVYSTIKSGQDEILKTMKILDGIDKSMLAAEQVAFREKISVNEVLNLQAKAAAEGRLKDYETFNTLKNSLGQLQFHQSRTDQIMKSLPTASGALQALQANGAQMGVVSDQLSQLIQTQVTNTSQLVKSSIEKENQKMSDDNAILIAKARKCVMGLSKHADCQSWISYVNQNWPDKLK